MREALKTMPLFNPDPIRIPHKGFNGFRDSGDMMCVPETLLKHLQATGKNKKIKLEHVICDLELIKNGTNKKTPFSFGFTTT